MTKYIPRALALVLTLGAPAGAASLTLAGATLALSVSGCATVPAKPLAPEKLEGSRWKLVIAAGKMDHRVIEFKREGGSIVGRLVDHGRVLSQMVGIPDNMVQFKIRPHEGLGAAPNVFSGVYTTYQGDGMPLEREVLLTFYEDNFTWNLESATWSRVQ
jgi:hypothetical protein